MVTSGVILRWPKGVSSRHWPVAIVLGLGVLLRLAYFIAYPAAFMSPDSVAYLHNAQNTSLSRIRPSGYSGVLWPFTQFDAAGAAIVVQHLLALGLVAAGYAFLNSRGLNRWLAAMAVLPLAIDMREVTIEHYMLSETIFTILVAAGLFLVAWTNRLRPVWAIVAGICLGYAAITRSIGLPLPAIVCVYLLVRRVGWRAVVGFVAPVLLLFGGYLVAYHHEYGVYAFTEYQGRFLYARVMPIADCVHLNLPSAERGLCPTPDPLKGYQAADHYIWSPYSPATRLYPSPSDDAVLGDFAWRVIRQQPWDYGAMVGQQTTWYFVPDPPLDADMRRQIAVWLPPNAGPPGPGCTQAALCLAAIPTGRFGHALRVVLADAAPMTTPGPLLALCVLIVAVGAVWRPRTERRLAGDAALFGGVGLFLIVASTATSMYEPRYAVPSIAFLPIGAVLALHRLWRIRLDQPAAVSTVGGGEGGRYDSAVELAPTT